MASMASGLRQLRCARHLAGPASRWQQLAIRIKAVDARPLTTETKPQSTELAGQINSAALESVDTVGIPFRGVSHARAVPASPSYFTREPNFNDTYIRLTGLLTKYYHLPTVPGGDAPQQPWMRLEHIRQQLGEPIKASHFARVLRVAKRLNLIEPSMRPDEVEIAIKQLTRTIDPLLNRPRALTVDKFGRAVGVGKRKESTARAFVVEGTGEVLINGKTLSEAFGRVHDRESAIWALTSTQRLDKYNVWALVRGGGTTGQAEALTLAVAKALLAHEPALKSVLRKAGCITRDPRTVERKKHGHVKARKMPAWVKR
jgi:small subunit ribosomal protein S9